MTTETDDSGQMERVPPQDFAAEQALLGSMLYSRDAITDATEILRSEGDFYQPRHRSIYRAIVALDNRDEPVDPITVAAELGRMGEADRIGGPAYLHTLAQAVPIASNAREYAKQVHAMALFSDLAAVGVRIAQLGYKAEGDVTEVLDAAGSAFNAAVTEQASSDGALIGDTFEGYLDQLEALQRHGQTKGVPTGFKDLDALTGGLHPGQLVIIAARPAMGKSTLAVDIARSCSIHHEMPSVFFSLEMGRKELTDRTVSAEAQVALHRIRNKGGLTDRDWTRIADVTPRVTAAPLVIDDTPGQTVMRIKSRCRRLQQTRGLALVTIDYLQLLTSGASHRAENRQLEVSEMTRNLKLMAKELDVPVVVLAQLNRGPEQRADKKPMLADLRESGAIEQDADMVILLHREDAYEEDSPRAGEADLIVAKHRNGPTGTVTVAAQLHFSRFVDMAQEPYVPADLRAVTNHMRAQQSAS